MNYQEGTNQKVDFRYYKEASNYIKKEEYDKAFEVCKRAMKNSPDRSWIYNIVGIIYTQKKLYDKSIELLQRLIKLRPNFVPAYCNLGVAYSKKEEYKKAIKLYKTAIKFRPREAGLYHNLGTDLFNMGQHDEAIKRVEKAIRLRPGHSRAYFTLGNIIMSTTNCFETDFKCKIDKAIKLFNKCIKLEPRFIDGYYSLAKARVLKDHFDRSVIKIYSKILTLNPNDARAYYWLGCFFAMNRFETKKAKYYFKKAKKSWVNKGSEIGANKAMAQYHSVLAFEYWKNKAYDRAKDEVSKSIRFAKKGGLKEMVETEPVLIKIISVYQDFSNLYKSKDLIELRNRSGRLYNKAERIYKSVKIKLRTSIIIATRNCMLVLSNALQRKKVKINLLHEARKGLTRYNLMQSPNFIDLIETFVIKLDRLSEINRYRTLREIPKEQQIELIKLFHMPKKISQSLAFQTIDERIREYKDEIIKAIETKKAWEGKEKLEEIRLELKIPKEIEVNFSKDENYIKFDGKETEITGNRIYLLLEELINRKVLHWSWGLVVFDEWQKNVPDDPVKQFGMAVRRFNDEFGFVLIDYLPREKKKGKKEKRTRWALIKDITIKSTIHESNNFCKETKKQKDPRKKLKFLDKALSSYPNSLEAIKLLVHLLQNNPALIEQEKELIGKILPSAYDALVKRRDNLKGAIERIGEKASGERPSYWKEAKSYSYEMRNKLKEIESALNIIEKFLENKKVTPGEDELNKITEDWELLEKLANAEQGSDEEKYYKELLNQHFGRPVIKEILNKVCSKVQHRIADMGLRDDRKDIAQEVFTYYLTLIRKGHFAKRNFKNIEELKGTLITGLSLKATDEIIKIKYQGNLTEANLRMIRDLLRAERELTQELYREPNDNEILKKLGPQWNMEKIEEIYDLKDELFKDERHIDIEKAQEFIEEVKRYEKEYREGIEQFFES